jgi:two-component system sensor histidine kinase KdpD
VARVFRTSPANWHWLAAVFALLFSAVLSAALLPLRGQLSTANVVLLLLLPVLAGAMLGGLLSGVVASVSGTLAFDLLFLPPYGRFSVDSTQDVLTLVLYLGMGALTADLARRARQRADEATRRADASALLYDLSRALLSGGLQDVLRALVTRIGELFELDSCAILLAGDDQSLQVRASWGREFVPPSAEDARQLDAVAAWTRREGEPLSLSLHRPLRFRDRVHVRRAGPDPSGSPSEEVVFLPLLTGSDEGDRKVIGLLRLVRMASQQLKDEDLRVLTTFGTQAALAVERARFAEAAAAASVLRASDAAKSALLANVSHELRTPLTTIRAAAESLVEPQVSIDATTRGELLESIRQESERLSLLVANLLDLSRLEAGALKPDMHLYDLSEIIGGVLTRLAPRLAHHCVHLAIDEPLEPLLLDYALMDQVMVNLLDNAVKYTPAGTAITVGAHRGESEIILSIQDEGPGIPPEVRSQVFTRFYRVTGSNRPAVPGTGLGLAICSAAVQAMGGRIWIDAQYNRGVRMYIALPVVAAVAAAPDAGSPV